MQRKGGKSDGGEKRSCSTVLILWPLSQTSPSLRAPPLPSPSLFLVLSFFPPVLLGIKTSIHATEETHSRGEKRGRRRREERGGGVKVGQFVDRWDQARCLKSCVYVCVCMSVFTQRVLPEPMLYYLRSGGICASQSVFWESWVGKFGNWAPFKTSTLGLMLQFYNYVFSLQPQFSIKRT